MSVSDGDLHRITAEIFATMLGLEAVPGPVPDPADLERPVHTGCVQITGAWEGAIVVRCPASLARRAASAMLGVREGDCTPADLHDIVGELANMTGGNVKALLDGACQLSLPAVTQGVDYTFSVPHTRVVAEAAVHCGGSPFLVTVHERA